MLLTSVIWHPAGDSTMFITLADSHILVCDIEPSGKTAKVCGSCALVEYFIVTQICNRVPYCRPDPSSCVTINIAAAATSGFCLTTLCLRKKCHPFIFVMTLSDVNHCCQFWWYHGLVSRFNRKGGISTPAAPKFVDQSLYNSNLSDRCRETPYIQNLVWLD